MNPVEKKRNQKNKREVTKLRAFKRSCMGLNNGMRETKRKKKKKKQKRYYHGGKEVKTAMLGTEIIMKVRKQRHILRLEAKGQGWGRGIQYNMGRLETA